jgi:Flp pilus assembly protein CpaB
MATAAPASPRPAHAGLIPPDQRSWPGPGRPRLPGRRPLPSGRALVGGLLVAVAMLVTYAAATHHDRGPGLTVVVARHQIRPGAHLARGDLVTARVDLPSPMASETYASVGSLEGMVTVAPMEAGDLVERAEVVTTQATAEQHELSFPIDRERALDGDLEPGQSVDLLATYGTGPSAQTLVVARGVRLIAVDDDAHQSLEGAGKLVITVAVTSADAALAATHASQVGALTLVEADLGTGSAHAADGATSYSVPSADPGASRDGATGAGTQSTG